MTMGSQGVGGIIQDYVDDVIAGALWDLEQNQLDNLDVAILCGANETLRSDLVNYCKKKMFELCGGEGEKYQRLAEKLHFNPLPKLTLSEVAILGKTSEAFLSKPGGGTTAEALFGEFPMIIRKEEEHPWEFGNIEELVQHNATLLHPNQTFYKAAKQAQRTRAPNLNAPEDCVEYTIEALWRIEQARDMLKARSSH